MTDKNNAIVDRIIGELVEVHVSYKIVGPHTTCVKCKIPTMTIAGVELKLAPGQNVDLLARDIRKAMVRVFHKHLE